MDGESGLIALGQVAFNPTGPPLADATIRQQQQDISSLVECGERSVCFLEGQLREERQIAERDSKTVAEFDHLDRSELTLNSAPGATSAGVRRDNRTITIRSSRRLLVLPGCSRLFIGFRCGQTCSHFS